MSYTKSQITDIFNNNIVAGNYVAPTAQIILPSKVYATVGIEMNIYWENFVFTNFEIDKYDMVVTCTKGSSLQRCWRYTPISGDVGNTTFLIQVFFDNILINSATTNLYTVATTSGTGVTRKLINIGDSTTDAGIDTQTVNQDSAGNPMTIITQGIRGTNTTSRHEGRTGWQAYDYQNGGSRGNYYSFFIASSTTLVAGATYTNNGITFTLVDLFNAGSGGSGRINCTASGAPTSSGTLTKSSGTGDSTITFSAFKIVNANPFWNNTTSQVDFPNYLTEYGFTMGSGDWVRINLGINDIFSIKASSVGNIDTQVPIILGYLNTLITSIQSVTGVRVAICLIHAPTNSLDAFGAVQLQTMIRYVYNWRKLLVALQAQYDTPAMNTAGIYVLGYNLCNDRVLNYPTILGNANARNTTQINYTSGGVHPATGGYQQMGDCLYSFIKNLV